MKITKSWLDEKRACSDGVEWWQAQKEKDGVRVVKALIADDKLDYANWLIVRVMEYKQYVGYAIYAAEQVLDKFEKKYPDDKRPRQAIEAAKKCLANPTKKNKAAADAAAYAAANAAADAAAYAAYAAYAAADAAAYAAAYAAADAAADAAAYAANAAYAAADAAAYAAANAAARKEMKLKILNYGLKLLKRTEGKEEKK